jgi:fluoride exporter
MAVKLFWLAVAGTLGTWARFGLSGAVSQWTGGMSPYGTLAVNVLGSFLFGVVWTLAEERALISAETRLIILVGFMGAFTTFSTFAFETGQLLRDAEWLKAGLNLLAQNVVGIAALLLGLAVGRQF